MVEKGIGAEEISQMLNITKATFYRRLRNKNFTVLEAVKIAEKLKMNAEELEDIFFGQKV